MKNFDNLDIQSKKILILVPVCDEELNLSFVIDELKSELPDIDLLIINDGSSDNSLNIIKNSNVQYINIPLNIGYSLAIQTGYKYALDKNYDYLIQFDGDRQHIASEAKRMLQIAISDDADLVLGSRFMGNNNSDYPLFRRIGKNIMCYLIKIICQRVITDPTSGFQIINNKLLNYLGKINYFPQFADANLIIDIILKRYTVIELAIDMRPREFGKSMYYGLLSPGKYMIMIFYSIIVVIFKHFFQLTALPKRIRRK